MSDLEKNVNSYLEEVGIASEEHKKYLEKLNRVLDEMKNSTNIAERKHYISFKETVEAFDSYLIDKKIRLTTVEKDRFAVIAGSGLNNLAKKRMTEDLIHQVKDRVAAESELKAEAGKKREDIARLKKTGFWLADWYRLTKFAMEFGTITLFSHKYLSSSLDVIRLKAFSAYNEIASGIKNILDSYYYFLTILEYNSILKLYRMGDAIEKLASLRRVNSYHPMEIFEAMNDFASVYITVMKNKKSIDSGLKKIFREHPPAHGFIGDIGFLTDREISENRIIRYSQVDRYAKTISGALYSYYTAYLGVRVSTLNQVMYIVNEEGHVNSSVKEYTPEAVHAMESETHEQNSDKLKIHSKLSELKNLMTRYSDMGKSLSKRLFEIEAKGNISAWNRDSQIKPFFMTMKVYDSYMKYILELIITHESFDLEYDKKIITGYFDAFPELVKAVEDYRTFSLELQGAKGKDLQNYKHPQGIERDEFISKLMERDYLPDLPGETRLMKETLNLISAKCYSICIRINEILNRYIKTGKIESDNVTENYNFILNAKVIHPKVNSLAFVLNKKEVFLVDFLEAVCSVAEYFAESLKNSGIKAINQEVSRLQKELEKYSDTEPAESADAETEVKQGAGENLESDIEKIYNDTLTGFRRWEYFEDFILPEYYNEEGNYSGDQIRHVFCAELSNFMDINRICGNDTGDRVYRKISEIINNTASSAGNRNIVLRGKGGLIIGYFNGISVTESIDLLGRILTLVREYSLSSSIDSLPELVFNAGIYTEKKGTNGLDNIEIARRIMLQGSDGKSGRIAFLRHQDRILTFKDFDRRGRLNDSLVSVIG